MATIQQRIDTLQRHGMTREMVAAVLGITPTEIAAVDADPSATVESPGSVGSSSADAVILAPLTDGRNVIAPAADGDVALATTQGRVGIGTGGDFSALPSDFGTSRLVVFDDSLAGVDEAVVQFYAKDFRPALRLYNLDSPVQFGQIQPWLGAFSEYIDFGPGQQFGQDVVQLTYGMTTPDDKPAFGAMVFGRSIYSDGFGVGARCETQAGVTADPSQEFVFLGADLYLQNYPLRVYPGLNAKWLRLDLDAIDTAVLANGDFSISFDPTNGAAKFKLVGKTNDGTVVHAEVAMAA